MAVQDIVLGGFGSTGTVSLIVTSGFSSVVISASSGMHRLAGARGLVSKRDYQPIDWSSPIFGEPPTPEIPITPSVETKPEPFGPRDAQIILAQEQNALSAIDGEIQSLLREVISYEGTLAELEAIEESIQERQRIAEAERLESDRKRRLALLLLLMAA